MRSEVSAIKNTVAGKIDRLTAHARKGKAATATIDPKDTLRKIAPSTIKMPAAINIAFGATNVKAPKPVATPFPPRNLSHKGNTWTTTKKSAPPAAGSSEAVEKLCPAIPLDKATAAAPFRASSNKVAAPSAGDLRET